MSTIRFDCPRSCPLAGEEQCRFMPLFRTLGPTQVNSHTVVVKCAYDDPAALRLAVESIGGVWIGMGLHNLFDTKQTGHGFRLPMANSVNNTGYWYHPLVLLPNGELAYDDYGGAWGDKTQLEKLKAAYATAQVAAKAEELGWLYERQEDGSLLVHHPSGGSLHLAVDRTCTTTGFQGAGCHDARLALGMEADGEIHNTAEFSQQAAQVQMPNGGQP